MNFPTVLEFKQQAELQRLCFGGCLSQSCTWRAGKELFWMSNFVSRLRDGLDEAFVADQWDHHDQTLSFTRRCGPVGRHRFRKAGTPVRFWPAAPTPVWFDEETAAL